MLKTTKACNLDLCLEAKSLCLGNTALHAACMYGHLEVIETLLRNPHTTVRLKNKKGPAHNVVF